MKPKGKKQATLPAFEALEERVLMAADLAGNSFAAARDIGTPKAAVYKDFVGAGDQKDFYEFELTEPARVALRLGNMKANADMILYEELFGGSNWIYRQIGASKNGGTKAEKITRQLPTGRYFVGIKRKWGNTNYTFRAHAVPDPGASLRAAKNLGTINGVKVVKGGVSAKDRYDTYKFKVDSRSKVNTRLYNLKNNADLELLNAAGQRMKLASRPGRAPEFIGRKLNAGTYYVRVRRRVGATTYKLSVAVRSLVPVPDGSRATARDLGYLAPGGNTRTHEPQIRWDSVSAADRNDYYRIKVRWPSTMEIRLTSLTADADVCLLNSAGTQLAASRHGGTANESITRAVGFGTYYIKVTSYDGVHTPYELSVWRG